MSTPKKYGDKTQSVPYTSKSIGGHVPLSTHGSTPMTKRERSLLWYRTTVG